MINAVKKLIVLYLAMTLMACQSSTIVNHAEGESTVPKISVQLWSVKDAVKQDFNGTLQQLAQMGFEGVEFAGEFGPYANSPQQLKAFLESLGLQASAAHTAFDKLNEAHFAATVDFYQQLGVETLIIAWDERAWDPEGVKQLVKELNMLSEKLVPYGMVMGFHNHDQEFNEYEEGTYWDYIAKNTKENVVLQLDMGWVMFAGNNPKTFIERYAGRTLTTHFKIRTPPDAQEIIPIIGRDQTDWPALIESVVEHGKARWIVVEQEEYPLGMTPLEAVAASKKGLDASLSAYLKNNTK